MRSGTASGASEKGARDEASRCRSVYRRKNHRTKREMPTWWLPLAVQRLTIAQLLDLLGQDYADRGISLPPGQV